MKTLNKITMTDLLNLTRNICRFNEDVARIKLLKLILVLKQKDNRTLIKKNKLKSKIINGK